VFLIVVSFLPFTISVIPELAAFPFECLYKFLYTPSVTTNPNAPSRLRWRGDSLEVMRTFSDEAKSDMGNDLERLERGEEPLDFSPMAPRLPGVFELRHRDKNVWSRLFYTMEDQIIYVLHCFTKKTSQTSEADIAIGKTRLSLLKQQLQKENKDAKRQKR
jgi:phage-related protein